MAGRMSDSGRAGLALLDHYRQSIPDAQTSPPHQQDVLSDLLAAALGGRTAARALDVGCGRGANLATLLAHAERVTAGDVSEGALRAARDSVPDVRARFVLLPGTTLPFADGAFDLVLCTEVLEHVPDLAAMATELERVTAPGGVLVVSTPNYWNVQGARKLWHDRRSGRPDWDPWHAHAGGLERFMTAGRLRAAFPHTAVAAARGADYATALGIGWAPLRRRVNRYLLLPPGRTRALNRFGMQYYLALRRR